MKNSTKKMKIPSSIPYTLYLVFALFLSCQKEITVDLPDAKPKIVVDGRIEPGLPPYIILTKNVPYFGDQSMNSIENMFIHNAVVKVSNGTNTVTLMEICTDNIPDTLLPLVASVTGIDTAALKNLHYCLYSTFDQSVWGKSGVTYTLYVESDGKKVSAVTTIFPAIPLDTLWCKYEKTNAAGDSLSFIWAHLSDPEQRGDAYRWLAMRKGKDYSFIAPPGSAFDDKYINGQSFDFAYNRGIAQFSTAEEDHNEERGYFKKGDTVIVKFCTIDRASFEFFRQMEQVIYNSGNPFSSPASAATNVYPENEALGLWCGYGVATHTVVCK